MIHIFKFDPTDSASVDVAESTDALLAEFGNGSDGVRQDIDLSTVAVNGHNKFQCDGVIAARPVALVHELVVRPSLKERNIIDRLVAYGIGWLVAKGYKQAVFVVDPSNVAMQKYLEEMGAVADSAPRILYFLNLK